MSEPLANQSPDSADERTLELYLARLKKGLRALPRTERDDVLIEIEADIWTEFRAKTEAGYPAADILPFILDRLGPPEAVSGEILAHRVFSFRGPFVRRFFGFAARSFIDSVVGFCRSGVIFILYIYGLLFFAMSVLKFFIPDKVGLFFDHGVLRGFGIRLPGAMLGFETAGSEDGLDVLGIWLVPVAFIAGWLVLYAANFLDLKIRLKNRR